MLSSQRRAVFTSCNLDYLDRAYVLCQTLKIHNSNVDFILVLSDFVDNDMFDSPALSGIDLVISSCDLGIDNFRQWSFQFSVIELCTAIKGAAFIHILKLGYDEVLYLDPDIACFSSLEPVFISLETDSIILTPHQLKPAATEQEFIDNELCSFKHGIFNLGFMGIRGTDEALDLLTWWSARLYYYCKEDTANGIFTDQKWMDAVPAFFDDFRVLKHPGLNVASWNLCERELSICDNGIMVNKEHLLIFYHFTKYFSDGVTMTKRYATTLAVISIWNWYGRKIAQVRYDMPTFSRKGKYQLFRCGNTIKPSDRVKWSSILASGRCPSIDPYESSYPPTG